MPSVIDPETIHVDELPGVWSPVQWEMAPEERELELLTQTKARLLDVIDIPEAMLRAVLDETETQRCFGPPEGYNPDEQGVWDYDLLTFEFRRNVKLVKVERDRDHLYAEYKVEDLGYWAVEIKSEEVNIYRI